MASSSAGYIDGTGSSGRSSAASSGESTTRTGLKTLSVKSPSSRSTPRARALSAIVRKRIIFPSTLGPSTRERDVQTEPACLRRIRPEHLGERREADDGVTGVALLDSARITASPLEDPGRRSPRRCHGLETKTLVHAGAHLLRRVREHHRCRLAWCRGHVYRQAAPIHRRVPNVSEQTLLRSQASRAMPPACAAPGGTTRPSAAASG